MGILSTLNTTANIFKGSSLPTECERYFFFAQRYLEGFRFDYSAQNTVIAVLKRDYGSYCNFKKNGCLKHDKYLQDFIAKCKNDTCAEAWAILCLYEYVNSGIYNEYLCSYAYKSFKKTISEEVKKLDRTCIPESFFSHFYADENLQKEEDYKKKYLELLEENQKLRWELWDYENNNDEDIDDENY
jgi:hypothetical protein